ncbi:MAG: TetR/AcrR family transcriptional regulator [Candidatus Latescibacteria bacterium]|nr:TetR/AcrR family transcriptional regulator [Candidatus Latescibacterota bacterium]
MNPMSSDLEIRNRILETAREQFFKFGFTRVTMDEIASHLGMSKKTLYKFFPGKDDLLREVVKLNMREIERGIDAIVQSEKGGFVEKLKELMTFLAMRLAKIGPLFMQDLQRNAPEIWKEIEAFRRQKAMRLFGDLTDEGIRKGVFRGDLNPQLLTIMYVSLIQSILNAEVLSQLPLSAAQAFEAIIQVLFEGILTDEMRANYAAHQGR